MTGECDFVMVLCVPDMQTYNRFCDEVLYADDNMKKFRTLISRKRSKLGTSATIRLDD